MCGIFGVWRKDGLSREDLWSLRNLADAIEHRGPDGEGFHLERSVGIGMRRLAIIDPAAGWQPLYNEDQSVILVANGEIYNHVELRNDLLKRGHRFATGSDCETILHLYEEDHERFVTHLRGMFGFALIDTRRSVLILCRDRLGEKPLVITQRDGYLAFCSELTGLVASGVVSPEPDIDAIVQYFHWGFIPEPKLPYLGARKLGAASLLKVDLKSGQITESEYWNILEAPAIHEDPVPCVRRQLEEVSKIIMRSDRPIGVCLSAGIDSSALAVMALRHAEQPVTALTIGYPGRSFQDESGMAMQFAQELGLPCRRVEVTSDAVVKGFREMCSRRDEPIADIAGSSLNAIARAAHESDIPVLLSGLGGDELFWGYRWHRDCVSASYRARQARAGKVNLLGYLALRGIPPSILGAMNWAEDLGGLWSGVRDFRRDLAAPNDQLVFWDATRDFGFAQRRLHDLCGERMRDHAVRPERLFTGPGYWDRVDLSLTQLIVQTYLASNGLAQTDRLFMANSVESRVPLVDYRLVETIVGLRKARPDHMLQPKAWLRGALRSFVPDHILDRRKRGFTPPWRSWLPLMFREYGDDLVDGILVQQGILSPAAVRTLIRGQDWLRRPVPLAFQALVLEQWSRGSRASRRRMPQMCDSDPHLPASRWFTSQVRPPHSS